ncbi:MAG: hypothetical protein ABII82_08550 [Verrucomicrobiota bacterium]
MSQIATALAKAKERPVTQAPFMVGAVPGRPIPGAVIPKRFSTNIIWGIVLALSIGTAGTVYWLSKQVEEPADIIAAAHAEAGQVGISPGPTGSVTAPVAGQPTTPAAALARMTRNESAVRQLSISAVLPGEQPRVMANGKIYHVGDVILPPDISFAGTENGQLIFTDLAGNRFVRRF